MHNTGLSAACEGRAGRVVARMAGRGEGRYHELGRERASERIPARSELRKQEQDRDASASSVLLLVHCQAARLETQLEMGSGAEQQGSHSAR